MSSSRNVHFRADERLIERADALATVEHKNRTDIVIEALRKYLDEELRDDQVREEVAEAYYQDVLTFEQVKALVGIEEAQNLRVLKNQLTDDSLVDELAEL